MCGVSNLEWISQLKGSMNALGAPLDGMQLDTQVRDLLPVAHRVSMMKAGKTW